MKKPHFYQTKAQKLETRRRIPTSAMSIDVLKMLDEGIRPILDVRYHGVHQRLLLHLLLHWL
jgi:hypothetical protein